MKLIILTSILILVLTIGFAIFYFFIIPPKIVHLYPPDGSENIALNSLLIIKFDKPIKRQAVEFLIIPEAYGELTFEDPLIKNHLFRTLIFKPAINFQSNTQYQVKLKNIISPLGFKITRDFSFTFKTIGIAKEIPKEGLKNSKPERLPPQITLLNIPLDWQDYPLSCEAACLKMALAYKGIYVSENEILKKIGVDFSPRKDNVWGDPHQIYVGNFKGKICSTGYGVYWEPVERVAKIWREAEAFSGWELKDLIREIQNKNPIIVWGVLPVNVLNDCSWYTPEGKYIKAYKETHVRLVIGFIGPPENPSKIILNDPLDGRLYWERDYFLKNWSVFNNSGVVVR